MLLRLGLNDETNTEESPEEQSGTPPSDGGSSSDDGIQPEPADEPNPIEPPTVQESGSQLDYTSSVQQAIQQLENSWNADGENCVSGDSAADNSVPEDPVAAAFYWLSRYAKNPSEAEHNVRQLAARSPESVVESVLRLCGDKTLGEVAPFLASMFSSDRRMVVKLCDSNLSLDLSVSLAQQVKQHQRGFDVILATSVLARNEWGKAARQRGLAILEHLDCGPRLASFLIQFLRDPDTHIRAKAARIFGQVISNPGVSGRLMDDHDPRVRANFVEGLWSRTDRDYRSVFRRALEDPHHRVAANALIGLHRLGEGREVVGHLSKMVSRTNASFRAAAAWVMGEIEEERFVALLRQMIRDPDAHVRRRALHSLRRMSRAMQ